MPLTDPRPILITGATGYVGARLIPRLLSAGYRVRALARTPAKLAGHAWGNHPHLEIVKGDLFEVDSLHAALRGCRAAYYLVHSMAAEVVDFAASDRQAAQNMVDAAAAAGVERIIYLTGLGVETDRLSEHLRSRAEVAHILQSGPVPVTVFRAGVILGSGSASFELIRYLVDRLPVMVTPRWIDTCCQPISIVNVLGYLVGCLVAPATIGATFDIGQEEIISYRRLLEIYAEEAGLPRRLIIKVPVLTPRLSSWWINLVTPLPMALARPLVEGMRNPVICCEERIRTILPLRLLDASAAIHLALDEMRSGRVESSWRDTGRIPPAEWSDVSDPDWAGGTSYSDARWIELQVEPHPLWKAITCLGGGHGWYFADWLWQLRGLLDRLVGGVGLQRGRRCALDLRLGDALDFWRVAGLEEQKRLLLVAEMKLPGVATLEFRIEEVDSGVWRLYQIARYLPRGLGGILYWYAVLPLHHLVFDGMLKGLAQASGGLLLRGPLRCGKGGR